MSKLQKKMWLQLDGVVSSLNKTELNGIFQFDSLEKLDDNKTCYVSKKVHTGIFYLIPTEVAEKSIIEPQPKYY